VVSSSLITVIFDFSNLHSFNMKVFTSLALASVAVAIPADLATRAGPTDMVQNELTKGPCKDVTFIWVRGTTETSNMGQYIGKPLLPELRKAFPSLAVEGVTYGAGVAGNLIPGGGDQSGIAEAVKDYTLASTKCPDTVIIGGGYSQGAAITHRSVEKLPETIKSRIAGIVLYGDTQYKQDGGKIKTFPPEKVHVFCNGYAELKGESTDGVCGGGLNVNMGHMSYSKSMAPGAAFLKTKVDEYKSKKGSK